MDSFSKGDGSVYSNFLTEAQTLKISNALNELLQPSNRTVHPPSLYPGLKTHSHLDCLKLTTGWAGYARIELLLIIALRCPNLTIEALKLSRQYIMKETKDVNRYKAIYEVELQICKLLGLSPPEVDEAWLKTSSDYNHKMFNDLRIEYQKSRENRIQESIRLTSLEMGELAFKSGSFTNAISQFSKASDDCVVDAQRLDTYFRILRVSIAQFKYNDLNNVINRIESLNPSLRNGTQNALLQAASGLSKLYSTEYRQAAHKFIDITFNQHENLCEIISPHTVAKVIALCSLATFERNDIKTLVLSNSNSKQFLELEPKFRDMVQAYCDANYSLMLEILLDQQELLNLDLCLGRHLNSLISKIRRRALRQFILPYRSVSLSQVTKAFSSSEASIKKDICDLISSESLGVRLDLESKVIWSKHEDPRSKVLNQVNDLAKTYRRQQRTALACLNFQQSTK